MSGLLQPDFPPLLRGHPVGAGDPFTAALKAARHDVEPGLIHYTETEDTMRAAVTLAPEEPLERAIGVLWAVQLGLADALGSLAPPEVSVHFGWPDRFIVNGATCGQFRVASDTADPAAEPDWLIIGVALRVLPAPGDEPGTRPDETCLFAEGCGEITVPMLLEAWSRHMLLWIHHYLSDGLAPLHNAWHGKCEGLGGAITLPRAGTFAGLDERGGMLLRDASGTVTLPLTTMLEKT